MGEVSDATTFNRFRCRYQRHMETSLLESKRELEPSQKTAAAALLNMCLSGAKSRAALRMLHLAGHMAEVAEVARGTVPIHQIRAPDYLILAHAILRRWPSG